MTDSKSWQSVGFVLIISFLVLLVLVFGYCIYRFYLHSKNKANQPRRGGGASRKRTPNALRSLAIRLFSFSSKKA